MKRGFPSITPGTIIRVRHLSITDQRPPSPESTHHLIFQGGYR
jgi:hypothetical protein